MNIFDSLVQHIGNPIIYARIVSVDTDNYKMSVDVGRGEYPTIDINGFQTTISGLRIPPIPNSIAILYYDLTGKYIHIGSIYTNYNIMVDENGNFRHNKVQSGEVELRGAAGNFMYLLNSNNINIFSIMNLELNLKAQQQIMEMLAKNVQMTNDFMQIRIGEAWREDPINSNLLTPVSQIKGIGYQLPAIPEVNMIFGKRVPFVSETLSSPVFTFKLANPIISDDGTLPKFNLKGNRIICEMTLYDQVALLVPQATISLDEKGYIYLHGGDNLIPPIKNAARNGDATQVPIGLTWAAENPTLAASNPGMVAKAAANVAQMQILAPMFVSPMGPCTFIPTVSLTLQTEINEGSKKVIIGDGVGTP